MKTTLAGWIAGVFLMGSQVASGPWIAIQNARGQDLMSFVAQDTPFKPGVPTRVGERLNVRAADGRTTTGVAYYAWTTESSVRVVVLAEIPAAQAKPGSFPSDSPSSRYEQIAEFTLAMGESREVKELKGFGLEPTTVGSVRNFVCEAFLIFAAVAGGRSLPAAAAATV